jgi:imidazole glycerol-phosphate synthase subunit HisH
MIVIIDYKVGNITSVQNMLKKVGCTDVIISSQPEDIAKATKLILPGVGHFDYGMQKLKASGLVDVLNTQVLVKGKFGNNLKTMIFF